MRITIPVSGDGDAWMSHLPEINFEFDRILDADGKLVLSEVVALFARANEFCQAHGYRPTFMTSSGDGFNVYSMTIEFLRQLAAVTHWIENRPGSKAHVSADGSAQDRRLERRMNRDQVAFCRIDVYSVASGVKFLVGYGNPKKKIIGNCETGAHECAIYLTRILLNMAESVNALSREKNAGLRVTVEGRDPELVSEAHRREAIGHERDEVRKANEQRMTCVRRLGGYCSPSDPRCRCYRDGRCVELELPEV